MTRPIACSPSRSGRRGEFEEAMNMRRPPGPGTRHCSGALDCGATSTRIARPAGVKPLDCIFPRNESLINTGASARWKDPLSAEELSQQFVKSRRKPLKRLTYGSPLLHRAKASVLM